MGMPACGCSLQLRTPIPARRWPCHIGPCRHGEMGVTWQLIKRNRDALFSIPPYLPPSVHRRRPNPTAPRPLTAPQPYKSRRGPSVFPQCPPTLTSSSTSPASTSSFQVRSSLFSSLLVSHCSQRVPLATNICKTNPCPLTTLNLPSTDVQCDRCSPLYRAALQFPSAASSPLPYRRRLVCSLFYTELL